MRITTRIAAGLFLVAALLIGALSYQLSLVDRIQGINRELSLINLEAARVSILLVQGLEGVREFAAKASALGDEEYRQQWEEWEGATEGAIAGLRQLDLSGTELAHLEEIEAGWGEYRERAPLLWDDPLLVGDIDLVLDRTRNEVEQLIALNESSVAARAAGSAAAGERARLVARAAAWSGLLVAGGASLFLFLSISGPLRRLTRGTRALAEGRFDHRLETSGPAELASLARDFNHMAERLDELEELKRDFVSHVSHELKTPLAAMHETVEVLLEELPGPLTARQRHLLELSRNSSGRLGSMIADLLEASRLEAGGVRWEPSWQDAGDIVDDVLAELHPLAMERGIRLDSAIEPGRTPVLCDEDRIREVIGNLVGNALKFSPEEGRVEVVLSRSEVYPPTLEGAILDRLEGEEGPFLVLSVTDEGAGIADEHKGKIFEKFHQVAGKRRLRGQGVGLGLSISSRIVEAHGGAIWVEDAPRAGARFRVLLPVEPKRWRNMVPRPKGQAPTKSEASRPRRGADALSSRSAVLLAAFLPLAGCATLPGFGGSEAPEPEPVVEEVVVAPEAAPPPAPEPVDIAATRLARAWILKQAGHSAEAAQGFELVLGMDLPPRIRAEALWGIALIRLSSGSGEEQDEAMALLGTIGELDPEGLLGMQATWALQSLAETTDLRRGIADREARIRELDETLDMLRRIDLERRPSGGTPAGG